MDHDFPVRLHKAVGRLTDSGGGKDVGSIVEKMLPNLRSEKFSITIILYATFNKVNVFI